MAKPSAFAHVKKSGSGRRAIGGSVLQLSRAAKYGYSNARVSAMKGLLLKKEFLNEMTRVGSMDAVVEMLERTYYKDDLAGLSMHYHGAELVQIASSMHFAEIANKLERITPEGDKDAFNVMLTKWDITNAKAILNARRIGKAYEDVAPYIIPIGSFTEDEVKSLLAKEGENIYVKFTKTRLGRRLIASRVVPSAELEKLFARMGTEEIVRLDALLDAFYYSLYNTTRSLATKDLSQISGVFKREIDVKNASIIVRLKQHGITGAGEISKYFIKGGLKQLGSFSALIDARGAEETMKAAAKLFDLKVTPQNAVELETMLNKKSTAAKVGAFYRSVLSIGKILGFLFLKEEEINNLRKIAVGKEFGMQDAKIAEILVFPN